jgi:hypothetical protein
MLGGGLSQVAMLNPSLSTSRVEPVPVSKALQDLVKLYFSKFTEDPICMPEFF